MYERFVGGGDIFKNEKKEMDMKNGVGQTTITLFLNAWWAEIQKGVSTNDSTLERKGIFQLSHPFLSSEIISTIIIPN